MTKPRAVRGAQDSLGPMPSVKTIEDLFGRKEERLVEVPSNCPTVAAFAVMHNAGARAHTRAHTRARTRAHTCAHTQPAAPTCTRAAPPRADLQLAALHRPAPPRTAPQLMAPVLAAPHRPLPPAPHRTAPRLCCRANAGLSRCPCAQVSGAAVIDPVSGYLVGNISVSDLRCIRSVRREEYRPSCSLILSLM